VLSGLTFNNVQVKFAATVSGTVILRVTNVESRGEDEGIKDWRPLAL